VQFRGQAAKTLGISDFGGRTRLLSYDCVQITWEFFHARRQNYAAGVVSVVWEKTTE
jgi:hypothetical protein